MVVPKGPLFDKPIDAVAVGMKPVVAELEMHDQEDDQTGGQADGKAKDIYACMDLVFPELANGDQPVVF